MLENIKYANISSIYTKNLIYYDEKDEKDLKEKCDNWGISYLPAKDRENVYKLENGEFIQKPLTPELQCNPFDLLFDESTLAKFERGNHDEVLFVTEKGKIKGVVHIVDYNNEFIYFEFYKLLFHFERMLRKLLRQKEETNQTLLLWMKSKAKKEEYWEKRYKDNVPDNEEERLKKEKKRNDFMPFQTFLLSDLLSFTASKGYVSKLFRQNINGITSLRNWVAHNKDITSKKGASDIDHGKKLESPLYKIEELKKFVKGVNGFFIAYEELESKVNVNNEISKGETKNLGWYYFEKFQKELHLKEDQELISRFNREVGINAWGTARASFLAALHKEFEIREFDFSAIGDSDSLSFKDKIWLGEEKKIHIIKT